MADRAVYKSGKDRDGDITSLCGSMFGSVPKATAISHIESGLHSYHVPLTNGTKARIDVVPGASGKYLRTNWDGTTRNNLDDLPDC